MNYRSKNQIVYEMIREAIITGRYAPNERLIIDNIAQELEVSHSPVRECMRQLESDGFVTIQPNTGATVTSLDINLISEVFSLLEALEIMSSRLACTRITDEQIHDLEQLVAEMDKNKDPRSWSNQNIEFHMLLCDIAGMSLVKSMMRHTLYHWQRYQYYYLHDILNSRLDIAQADHVELLAVIKQADPHNIEAIIQQHNRKAFSAYVTYLEQHYEDYTPIPMSTLKGGQ